MAKLVIDACLDAALNYLKTNGTRMCICDSQPTTYSLAVNTSVSSGYMLAAVSISSADFTGPADGGTSGRKITINAQSSISITATGSAAHVAIVDVSSTALLYVTTCTAQSLTATNKVNSPAWVIELRDPT